MQHVFFIILLLFLTDSASTQKAPTQTLPSDAASSVDIKHQSFLLTDITFESDIPLSKKEFTYLTNLTPNIVVHEKHLKKARTALLQKNRFKHISISIKSTNFGKSVHFTLIGNWIIKNISCRGVAFGKERYLNCYSQQPGDVFNATLHDESLREISKTLFNEGLFDHTVDDEITYNANNKQLSITIFINKKSRFIIDKVSFNIPTNNGNNIHLLEKKLVKEFSSFFMGMYYSQQIINKQSKNIRAFLKKEGYSNSRIILTKTINSANKTITLLFSISLGLRLIPSFQGNTKLTSEELLKRLSLHEQPDWLLSPTIISEQIIYEYFKKGYWNTKVTFHKKSPYEFVFIINEGYPFFIECMTAINTITNKQENTLTSWENSLTNTILDQTLLNQKIQELESYNFSQGFWDFSITEKRYIKTTAHTYKIVLFITQGTQRFLKRIHIPDFPHLEQATVFKKFQNYNNNYPIPFNLQWLQEQKMFLINYFQKLGYWYVTATPTFTQLPLKNDTSYAKTNVIVTWHISPGKQVLFGKTILRGNSNLPFKRIIREITFNENEPWDKEKLEQTRKKLKRFDIFKQVHVQPLNFTKKTTKKPIAITLIEDDPIELKFRAGYFLTSKNFLFKRESTPKIGSSFVIKNPSNRADKIMIDTDFTKFERKINLMYQQPSFLNLPVTGKLQAYANKYVHPVQIASSSSAYEATQNGFLCCFSNEYKNNYYSAITIGNEWQKTRRVRGNLKLSPSIIDKTIPYFFIEPSLIIDALDDKINPTKGTLSFLSLKFLVPEQEGNLSARLMAEQSIFYPIYKNIVVAFRIRTGHIFRRAFEFIMPLERFYLGGPYSVRGYEKDALPPLGESFVIKEGIPHKEFTIQGGSSMINTNLELRFTILKNLGLVLFQDIGALSQSGILGFSKTWYPSSGCGLRYKTPVGSLRFDIGWKWKKRMPEDAPYAWYLTLGEAF